MYRGMLCVWVKKHVLDNPFFFLSGLDDGCYVKMCVIVIVQVYKVGTLGVSYNIKRKGEQK